MNNSEQIEGRSLAEILKIRREKLQKIKELNFNPYGYEFPKTHSCNDVIDNFDQLENEATVKVAGRLMAIRRMGRASFCHIQDEDGRIQIYFQENKIGKPGYKLFKLLDIGDIIGITGSVFKTRTGEITVAATELKLLAKNLRPIPIVKEKDGNVFDAFTDKEQRYRQRYLDLIVNPSIKEVFKLRSKIIQWTREFLDGYDFLEVETPVLQPIYGGAFAKPFKTFYNVLNKDFYLRIADELYLKRLIIGGFEKVYEISKNFRNEGVDRNHNPEFTSLEFYQTYVDYNYLMDFMEEYFKFMIKKIGKSQFEFGEHIIDFSNPFEKRKMFDLIEEYIGCDVKPLSEDELRSLCEERGIEGKPGYKYGKFIELLFDNFVEHHLIQPTFVIDYPKEISPLAKTKRNGSDKIVERFELYIGGQEFANAFTELNDPTEQRERLEKQSRLRELGDEEAQAMDIDFITAMEYGMPPTGGVGLGIDRVVMLFTNQKSIKDVIFFPQMRT
ncbi:MAG: lysine--tRNA ligase [Candidatus Marinimicrobia bacterium]|nr:lysine--tRNA ligase [Candidatus Neomarinimicrobiota bacterium]